MTFRKISLAEAREVYNILVDECGYKTQHEDDFVDAIRTNDDESPYEYRGIEFRFIGALGIGGKFRNNGNGVPYVDCYPKDMLPIRQRMIERANKRLRDLFETYEPVVDVPTYPDYFAPVRVELRRLIEVYAETRSEESKAVLEEYIADLPLNFPQAMAAG